MSDAAPLTFEQLAQLARRFIDGPEMHTSAQSQILVISEGYLRLHEEWKRLTRPDTQPLRPIPPLTVPGRGGMTDDVG